MMSEEKRGTSAAQPNHLPTISNQPDRATSPF